MYDPPHLLKSIKNALYEDGFNLRRNVSFKYTKELFCIKRDEYRNCRKPIRKICRFKFI